MMLNEECDVPMSWRTPTVDTEVIEERDAKRIRLEHPLELDFELQNALKKLLPSLANGYKKEDWLVLRRYNSEGPSLDIKDTLKSEFAAISSVWLLFLEVPPHIKEGAARVLTSISFGTSEAPNVSNQESVEDLVLRVLCDNGGATVEVQTQVCLAICFLACCDGNYYAPEAEFGAGIQDRLLELIRVCYGSELALPLIRGIANIALYNKVMRGKILKTQLTDSWLGDLMVMCTKQDGSILKNACLAVACIASAARRKDCKEFWDHVKSQFMPAIVNKCCGYIWNSGLMEAAMLAIAKITKYAASSPEQIEDLVNGGFLKALFNRHGGYKDSFLSRRAVAIKIILKAGDGEGRQRRWAKHNKYAKMIDDFDPGWDVLLLADELYHNDNSISKAFYILFKYRPWLLMDHWMRVPLLDSDAEEVVDEAESCCVDEDEVDELSGDDNDYEAEYVFSHG